METTTAPVNGWHWREWTAEFTGTALLLLAVVTAKDWIVAAGPPLSEIWIRVALVGVVAGLIVVAVAVSPLGRRSGAHLNPAVTLGLAAQRTVGAADLAGYSLAQAVGGIAGVALARLWGPSVAEPAVRWAVIALADWLSPPAAVVIEAAATAAQLTVVFGCLASRRWARLAPVAAAALLAGAIAGLAPVSGAGFNPVRGLATDVLAVAFPALWVYFAGPLIGALAAAGLTGAGNRRPRSGKLLHDPSIPCYMRCELTHLTPVPAAGHAGASASTGPDATVAQAGPDRGAGE